MTAPAAAAVVLIGPMGAGKTSVGRRVAKRLGRPFTDTDKMVTREHGPISDLFAAHGEAHFRALERNAVIEALDGGGVVALGGGAVLDPRTRADLTGQRVVLLMVSPHIVSARIRAGDRPLLSGEQPIARWQRIYAERRALYQEIADVVFDTSSGPLAQIVSNIVDWVRRTENAPAVPGATIGDTEEHA